MTASNADHESYPLAEIGKRGYLIVDADGNNQQSAPDFGIANAYVRLYSSTNATRGDADDLLIGQAITGKPGTK